MTEPNETPIDASWEEMVEARNRPRTPHHALLMAVRAGQMTPKEADATSLAEGLPLRHDGWQELHDITTNSVWWLPLAVLFYAWRDLPQTREQWERYSVWEQHLWRDPTDERQFMSLEDAEAMLRSDLSAGIVRSFGVNAEGIVRPIPCENWESLTFGYGRGFSVVGRDGLAVYTGVFVLRHEVVPMLITEHVTSASTLLEEPKMRGRLGEQEPKKMGAAQKYDWPAAAAFAASYGMHHDYPEVKADFVERMKAWFKDRNQVPDKRDLERFVRVLYEGLEQKPEK